jgi:hypothetical protein
VFHFDIFGKDFTLEHPLNKFSIFVTWDKSQFDKSGKFIKDEQYWNMADISFKFFCFPA